MFVYLRSMKFREKCLSYIIHNILAIYFIDLLHDEHIISNAEIDSPAFHSIAQDIKSKNILFFI